MNRLEKFWDKQAKNYTEHEKKTKLDENKDFITTLKYLDKSDIVLDYGCATGIISNAIADKVEKVYAIDISPKMIEMAKAKAFEQNIHNVNYEAATIFDERYRKESFNVVLAFRILHVLKDVKGAVSRINELLKPGGIFISVSACVGDEKNILSVLASLASKVGIVPVNISLFKLTELQEIITNAGFQVLEYEKMDDKEPHYCIVAKKV